MILQITVKARQSPGKSAPSKDSKKVGLHLENKVIQNSPGLHKFQGGFVRFSRIQVTVTVKFWEQRAPLWPFKRQFHKMVKHTQTIRRQIAGELFECV